MRVTSEILKKYAKDECSESEKKIVEEWLNTPKLEEDTNRVSTSAFLGKKLWNNIKINTNQKNKNKALSLKKRFYLGAAASILLLVGLSTYHTFFNPNKIITYTTLAGEKTRINLSDSTTVHLNANSILTAPRGFTSATRTVSLKGEAYFEVSKDSLHPFIINTETSKTKVLGTKFNLSAYKNQPTVLTLEEGKVSFKDIKNPSQELILLPNQQGIIENNSIVKTRVNSKYYSGWLNNTFYFNNENFLSIVRKIEMAFGITIQVKDQRLLKKIYKGTYKNPTLKTLLDDLSFVLKFNYQIHNKKIIIY